MGPQVAKQLNAVIPTVQAAIRNVLGLEVQPTIKEGYELAFSLATGLSYFPLEDFEKIVREANLPHPYAIDPGSSYYPKTKKVQSVLVRIEEE